MKPRKNGQPLKILCISDIKDSLIYSPAIKERYGDVDLVLSAGDLNLDYYGYIVSMLNKTLYFVFGNHNLRRYKLFKEEGGDTLRIKGSIGGVYVGDKIIYNREKDLIIMGMGGCRRYSRDTNQYTEAAMLIKLLTLLPRLLWNRMLHGRYVDIFLSHASPRHLNDREDPCHKGFKVYRWFLRKFRPRYMLHGHIHLYDRNLKREVDYESTKIINVYSQYILELE